MSDVDDAAHELRLAIGRLARHMRRLHASSARDGGPVFLESAVLNRLARDGAQSTSELSQGERVTSQAVSAALSELQRRGMVTLVKDPADRRRTIAAITAAGHEHLDERDAVVLAALTAAMTSTLSGADLRRLRAAVPLLERISAAL
jgi:DNA-binding MarR family transcriptional regulator